MKIIFFVCVLFALSTSQLLGIDLGTMFTKVAMVQPGAGLSFAILENTKSERKIETAISFLNGQRFYENQAISKRTKSTVNSFLYTKMFIDMINDHQAFKTISKEYFLNHNIQADGNIINFILEEGFDDKITISIEQIFSMIFKHIKDLAQKANPKIKIQDCVLTVPYDWNLDQRIILINALKIAGLTPLYIVTENTAAAVHYGANRQSNSTHNVLFYNLGANYLELSVAEFRKQGNNTKKSPTEISILGGYGANNVGGLQFDRIILEKLKTVYEKKHKKELTPKGIIRLLSQSKKVKQILSANKDIHVALEELDGVDFHTVLTRNEFEQASTKLLEQITDPIIPFLKSIDLSPSDIKYVELIGGSIRMPKLQQMIAAQFPSSEVGTHINGDEAMALGSAFLAANSSKKYKVKGLQLYDGFHNFDVIANIRNLNKKIEQGDANYVSKSVKVFKRGQRFGLIKDVLLKTKANLEIEFVAEYQDGSTQPIKRIKLLNITDFEDNFPNQNPKLALSIKTHSINVVDLVEAKLNIVRDEQSAYFQQVKKPSTGKSKAKDQSKQDEDDNQQAGKPDINSDDEQVQENDQNQAEVKTQKQSKKEKAKSNEAKEQYQTVRKTRLVSKTHSLKLKLEEQWLLSPFFSEKQLESKRNILYRFEKQESQQKKLAEAKNKLESSIYQAQDLLEVSWFKQYSTPAERQKIKEQMEINEEKLYEQLDTATFNQIYKQFYKLIEKIKTRKNEQEERDRVKITVYQNVLDYKQKYFKYIEQNDWIPQASKETFTSVLESIENELDTSYDKLADILKTDDPVILNKQLLRLADKLKEQYLTIVSLEKPKKAKKKQEDKEKEEKDKEDKQEDKKEENKEEKAKQKPEKKKKNKDEYMDQL